MEERIMSERELPQFRIKIIGGFGGGLGASSGDCDCGCL